MGTHGDVVPYLGLGQRLTAAGHRVTVATTARFGELVSSAGLAFHELPATDPREAAGSEQGRAAARGGFRGMLSATRTAAEFTRVGMRAFAGLIGDVRTELDLPATPAPGYGHDQLTVLHGVSPTVYPRPSDWRLGAEVVGY